ncbi:hypothetical protein M430DRAFT_72651, partial [Amorphotheca resinae ATCC 22711]
QPVQTSYISLPVHIPESFLAPLPDPSVIKTERIDFGKTTLPEYKDLYAVVLDNVLSREECDQLIHMAELSAGAHHDDGGVPNNGWRPAMINAGMGQEILMQDYRNSDRIIWDEKVLAKRVWERVLQGQGIKDYLSVLNGESYRPVLGDRAITKDQRWVVTEQGVNERLRFLKYGKGQFFRAHCDSAYQTLDEKQRSFYTLHLYLNDSAQGIGIPVAPLRGGATTFYSKDRKRRLDVDPKAGRVLIFQHRDLLHSGDDVVSGVKYSMRSDLMYQ